MRFVYYVGLSFVTSFGRTEPIEVEEGEDPATVFKGKFPERAATLLAFEPLDAAMKHPKFHELNISEFAKLRAKELTAAGPAPVVAAAPTPGPRKPAPVLPAEVHSTTKFNSDAAMEAVRALSKGA